MSTYSDAVLADGPFAYWRLGDSGATTVDAVGAHTGTLVAVTTTGVAGAVLNDPNTCMSFDAVNGEVTVADAVDLRLNQAAWTIELWFWIRVFYTGANSQRYMLYKGFGGSAGDGYSLFVDGNASDVVWRRNNDQEGGMVVQVGTWYHLVLVYDPTDVNRVVKFYLNGGYVGSSGPIGSYPTNTNTTSLHIGNGTNGWDGRLDEVAYYASALTSDRILAHFSAVSAPPATPATVTLGLSG